MLFTGNWAFLTAQTTMWDVGDDLTQNSGGEDWPWSNWGTEQLVNWKYFDDFGPVWQWRGTDGVLKSRWVYSYFHGWLFPSGDDLSSVWLYSIKYNKSWIWTSSAHFDLFYMHKVAGFYQYDTESWGQSFLSLSTGRWNFYYDIPDLFNVDLSVLNQSPPTGMVRIPQDQYFIGGNFPAEPYSDLNDNGVYDFNEPFEDVNNNQLYDSQIGYIDEYPSHRIDLSSYLVNQLEITNQLYEFIVSWSINRDDKVGDPNRDFFRYEYDSLVYVNYAQVEAYYRKMLVAEQNYNASPTQANKDIWDIAVSRYDRQIEIRNEEILEIQEYRRDNPNNPVSFVTWFDALKWCNAYSEYSGREPVYYVDPGLGGVLRSSRQSRNTQNVFFEFNNGFVKWNANGFRLPTEAEWEVAVRAGLDGKDYGHGTGDFLDDTMANIEVDPTKDPEPSPKPVGSYAPNSYGIYDMSGNVREWCWDWVAPYEDTSATFTLDIEPNISSFKVSIPDLAEPETELEVAETVSKYLKLFNPASEVTVGVTNNRLTFSLPPSFGAAYFVVRNPDRNAQNFLGLRDYDTSLNLTAFATSTPSRGWVSSAHFKINYVNLETGQFGEYDVILPPPSSTVTNPSPTFAFAEVINMALDDQNLDHLFKAVVLNDKLAITHQRGNPPLSYTISASVNDPFVSVLGFESISEQGIDVNTLNFEAFNLIRVHDVAKNPRGPEGGDVRSFRGGYWGFSRFFARVSLRDEYTPFLPTKIIGFRPVIGLPWDDR